MESSVCFTFTLKQDADGLAANLGCSVATVTGGCWTAQLSASLTPTGHPRIQYWHHLLGLSTDPIGEGLGPTRLPLPSDASLKSWPSHSSDLLACKLGGPVTPSLGLRICCNDSQNFLSMVYYEGHRNSQKAEVHRGRFGQGEAQSLDCFSRPATLLAHQCIPQRMSSLNLVLEFLWPSLSPHTLGCWGLGLKVPTLLIPWLVFLWPAPILKIARSQPWVTSLA